MAIPYNHREIESKWQKYWEEHQTFKTDVWDFSKPKYYALDMFPYPSGVGLHAGHPEGYTATDIMSRMKRMQGYNVLHPMGYDSFGLPAEQYAVTTGHHPAGFTEKNIETFTNQLKELGFDYDWSKMIATSDPKFYKWTQWIFKQLYLDGYAKLVDMPVNWCEELGTVLSNDEVIDGKSERGGYPVIRKNMKQWVIDQVAFADKLLEGLNEIDWPESTKDIQRHWIGRSEGVEVKFQIVGGGEFSIYTTCIETIYGITFMVLAPDGQIVKDLMPRIQNKEEVQAYIDETIKKNDMDRTELNKTKSGCELKGVTCINPVNGKQIPIFVSDYVLMGYGTGIVMGVPGHDQRDWDFATAFHIPIVEVVEGGDITKEAFTLKDDTGIMVNSGFLNGMTVKEAIPAMKQYAIEQGWGHEKVNYKLRDWVFSRQRYWGEPIPLVNCPTCGWVPVPEEELPLVLPQVESYEPTDDGESPISKMIDWVNTKCPKCGGPAKRETDTMPQWAGSSWYFLRYMDPHNDKALVSHEAENYWGPVDWYNGGMEHTTLHLLYSRFWHKFLYDIGVVHTKEPYAKRTSHGMILGQNPHYVGNVSTQEEKDALIAKYGNQALRPAVKMSKSLGNVVNPDDVVKAYGADTMRLYIMFIGDFEKVATWSDDAVKGCKRFLDRVWNLADQVTEEDGVSEKNAPIVHKTIKKVTDDIDTLKMNTAIAALMAMVNEFYSNGLSRGDFEALLLMLSPFAPHMVEELWEQKGFAAKYEGKMAMQCAWPEYDESKTVASSVEMAVQVSGKFKGTIIVPVDSDQNTVVEAAKASEKVAKAIAGMQIVKVIHVKNKLVNLIVKPC